jgi:hypothetical protein
MRSPATPKGRNVKSVSTNRRPRARLEPVFRFVFGDEELGAQIGALRLAEELREARCRSAEINGAGIGECLDANELVDEENCRRASRSRQYGWHVFSRALTAL